MLSRLSMRYASQVAIPGLGSVRLEETFGDHLTVVNAARVSFGGHSGGYNKRDKRLLKFLWREKHYSPFRHVFYRFTFDWPEFVGRQAYKHVVGIEATSTHPAQVHGFNEISGRYIEYDRYWEPEPSEWRRQSDDKKQGSDGVLDPEEANAAQSAYKQAMRDAQFHYKQLLALGVAREQARTLLPLSIRTRVAAAWSFQAVYNFIELRDHPEAQAEIREYAVAMRKLAYEATPELWDVVSEVEAL